MLVLGLGPGLKDSLRTRTKCLVLALALRVKSLVLVLALLHIVLGKVLEFRY